jgi:hypothetical protein
MAEKANAEHLAGLGGRGAHQAIELLRQRGC